MEGYGTGGGVGIGRGGGVGGGISDSIKMKIVWDGTQVFLSLFM